MKIKTMQYNPFDYLETDQEINDYLTDAFMDDDPRVFLTALGFLAKKHGMSELSRKTGLNRESLYKTLSSNGNPRFSTVLKVSKALGLKFNAKAA